GRVFGRLTALRPAGEATGSKAKWICRCTCGRTEARMIHSLQTSVYLGNSPHCGSCGQEKKTPTPKPNR
ncbi:MAG TPA: hypothetical protein VGE52_11060, partial [Pirellulales bacterium]